MFFMSSHHPDNHWRYFSIEQLKTSREDCIDIMDPHVTITQIPAFSRLYHICFT